MIIIVCLTKVIDFVERARQIVADYLLSAKPFSYEKPKHEMP